MSFLARSGFKQPELSDVDIIVRTRAQQVAADLEHADANNNAAAGDLLQLAAFPGHRVVVFSSSYFEAQVNTSA
jgi:hypothetical protein